VLDNEEHIRLSPPSRKSCRPVARSLRSPLKTTPVQIVRMRDLGCAPHASQGSDK